MNFVSTNNHALQPDQEDPLAQRRNRFVISDPDLVYLDGNSLGRLPKAAAARAGEIVQQEWGRGFDPQLEQGLVGGAGTKCQWHPSGGIHRQHVQFAQPLPIS